MRVLILGFIILSSQAAFSQPGHFGPMTESAGFYDLSASSSLSKAVQFLSDKQVVGLGEPIHGSHEFHVERVALIKDLVQYHGFRTIYLEAPWGAVRDVNRYMQGEEVSRSELASGLYFLAWNDKSVLELLKWLRDYNSQNPMVAVEIFGVDIQDPASDKIWLNQRVGHAGEYDVCLQQDDMPTEPLSPRSANLVELEARSTECKSLIERFLGSADYNQSSVEDYMATNSLLIMQELVYLWASKGAYAKGAYGMRDEGMFNNFLKIHNQRQKMGGSIFYGHNWHVGRGRLSLAPEKSIGNRISHWLGRDYAAVGMLAREISVLPEQFPDIPDRIIPIPNDPNCLEVYLNQADVKKAFIDLRNDSESPFLDGSREDVCFYQEPETGLTIGRPLTDFDYLFFIDTVKELQVF